MTDDEMIPRLADKVMGWEVFPLAKRGYSEWIGSKLIENVDHDWVYIPAGLSFAVIQGTKLWNPLEVIGDAFMLVYALRERNWRFSLQESDECWGASFTRDKDHAQDFALTAPRAISLAALQTVGGKK